MNSEVDIRERHHDDFQALGEIMFRVYESDRYPVEGVADTEELLRANPGSLNWVATVAQRVIGQVSLVPSAYDSALADAISSRLGRQIDNLAFISRLFVDPQFRKRGAAKKLAETALAEAGERGQKVALEVMKKDTAAIRLYELLGARHLADVEHVHSHGQKEPASIYVFFE